MSEKREREVGKGDLVAIWDVPLSDGLHRVEFEHGTTSGKRVIRVDDKELLNNEWMFKLVGSESFQIGRHRCIIRISPIGSFSYEYHLEVDGKSYKKFTETQSKIMKTWMVSLPSEDYRVVLEKDTLDIWVNGEKLEVTSEFVDGGTEMHFSFGPGGIHQGCIASKSSGKRREGLIYDLLFNGSIIPEAPE
ncbi:unnamed protein product [Darwinula stevensoni]|uniref:Fas apoptotic inhibitory molecule 1 n=1 Tax=Darwinula stevensoni TaxID=69355 RepID=A0A7R8XA69_9CRUS|nr:unnamed protein product [Darwinula stevensoni]CAG0890337.1 unnamed protein product [Darwinula stevensoni]